METTTRVVTHGTVEGTGRKAIRNAKRKLQSEVTIEKRSMNKAAKKANKRFDQRSRTRLANTAIRGASAVAVTTAASAGLAKAMNAPYGMFGEDDKQGGN